MDVCFVGFGGRTLTECRGLSTPVAAMLELQGSAAVTGGIGGETMPGRGMDGEAAPGMGVIEDWGIKLLAANTGGADGVCPGRVTKQLAWTALAEPNGTGTELQNPG